MQIRICLTFTQLTIINIIMPTNDYCGPPTNVTKNCTSIRSYYAGHIITQQAIHYVRVISF